MISFRARNARVRFYVNAEGSSCQGPRVSRGWLVCRRIEPVVEFEVPEVDFRRSIVQEWLRHGQNSISVDVDGWYVDFV